MKCAQGYRGKGLVFLYMEPNCFTLAHIRAFLSATALNRGRCSNADLLRSSVISAMRKELHTMKVQFSDTVPDGGSMRAAK